MIRRRRRPSTRELVGKTIVAVEWNEFDGGRGAINTDPVFTLSDGSKLHFDAQESEDTGYGVGVSRSVPNRHKKETST